MFVRNLQGEEFMALASYKRIRRVNGERELAVSFFYDSKVNKQFLDDIGNRWTINVQGDEYKVIYTSQKAHGTHFTLEARCIHTFHVDMKAKRMYNLYEDKSYTAINYFNEVFEGTGYTPIVVDSFNAQTFSDTQRGKTRLERFNTGLNRFVAEYYVVGKNVYIQRLIGTESSFMYAHRLNLKSLAIETDGSGFHTHAEGFGADGLTARYTSTLANVFGIIEGPPIDDERYFIKTNLERDLKSQVDNSLKVSVTIDVVDLRKQGYKEAQPNEGDRVWLIDKRVGFKQQVRIVEIEEEFDPYDNIIDQSVTLGDQSIMQQYRAKMNNAITKVDNLFAGKERLPIDVLAPAVKLATQLLHSAATELEFNNGIIAVDKNNPNLLVLLNSNGLGLSTDGGQTFVNAITALGINTNLLTAGAIHTNNIKIIGTESYFYWDGNELIAIDPNDAGRFVRLNSNGLYIAKGAMTIERPDGVAIINNGIPQWEYSVSPAEPPFTSGNVIVRSRYWTTDNTTSQNCQFWTLKRMGRYLNVEFDAGMVTKESQTFVSGAVEIVSGTGDLLATQVIMEEMNGDVGRRYTLRIDFGVPQLNAYGFYMRIRSGSTARGTIWARKVRIWVDG